MVHPERDPTSCRRQGRTDGLALDRGRRRCPLAVPCGVQQLSFAVPSPSLQPAAIRPAETSSIERAVARASALHAAAQCIRRTGIPGYADPGTPPRTDRSTPTVAAIPGHRGPGSGNAAGDCAALIGDGGPGPRRAEPPCPAAARAVACGPPSTYGHWPAERQPTPRPGHRTTPGHGFGSDHPSEMPRALSRPRPASTPDEPAHAQLTAEIQASTMESLGQ